MGWNDVTREKSEDKDKLQYTKFEQGNTLIRILDDEPFSFWQHWLTKQNTSVSCMGKDCPICGVIAQQKAANETPQYNSTQRHAIRIWNYTTQRMEILIQGRSFFTNLLELHKEVGELKTYDIKVIRKGQGKDTKYVLLPAAPAEFQYADQCEEVDMKEQFKAPTKEEMLMLMEGKTWTEINEATKPAA